MKTAPHTNTARLRRTLLPLAENCPADPANPADCPLHALREKTPAQRLQWFAELTADDLTYLASYCHVCMNLKLGECAELATT